MKWLLSIPQQLAVFFLVLAVVVTTWIAWWAILFTGKYPQTLFDFAVRVRRYNERVGSYVGFLTDKYPPFSLSGSPSVVTAALAQTSLPIDHPASDRGRNTASGVIELGEQLRELKRLRDENLLTDEEYERKRSELAAKF